MGNTPQERGDQLEELTKAILKSRGYTSLTIGKISSGGHEIDVCGELLYQGVGQQKQKIRLVCECKAHASPTDTTDWLKFLGKIYLEEIGAKHTVTGCFISLSGVNGNVSGSYDALISQGKNNIQLVSGEELLNCVLSLYKSVKIEQIIQIITNRTNKAIIGTSICYHGNNIYWLISLQEESYVVTDSSGAEIEKSEIIDLIRNCNEVSGRLLSLNDEAKQKEHIAFIEKSILTALITKQALNTKDLEINVTEYLISKGRQLTQCEFEKVLVALEKDGLVKIDKKLVRPRLKSNAEKTLFYAKLLSGFTLIDTIVSDNYRNLLNRQFLSYCITTYQCGLKLDQKQMNTVLKAVRVSPSALSSVLSEIQMITHHRKNQPHADKAMEEHDREYFERIVMEKLTHDFSQSALKEYFHNNLGIVEMETSLSIKVKSKDKIEFSSKYKKREGLGELTEELGGGIIRILALNSAPEPWERA